MIFWVFFAVIYSPLINKDQCKHAVHQYIYALLLANNILELFGMNYVQVSLVCWTYIEAALGKHCQ